MANPATTSERISLLESRLSTIETRLEKLDEISEKSQEISASINEVLLQGKEAALYRARRDERATVEKEIHEKAERDSKLNLERASLEKLQAEVANTRMDPKFKVWSIIAALATAFIAAAAALLNALKPK